MLTSLKAEHRKQLLFLAEQSPQVLQDFCKLALDYLQKGPNLKLYGAAAQRLQVEPEIIRSSVEGLINLLLESSKNRLDEKSFRDSVSSLGFQDEKEAMLAKLYEVKRIELDRALSNIGLQSRHYHDMEWRFQVQIASRSLLSQLTPLFTVDLMLKDSENSSEIEHVLLQADPTNLLHLAQELESAMADGKTQHIRIQIASRSLLSQLTPLFTVDLMLKNSENSSEIEHVLLQADPTNLLHLAQELESAMADGKTQHIRSIKRTVK